MDLNGIFQALVQLMNTSFGFSIVWAVMVALIFWWMCALNPFNEEWKQWEGSIITGIKLAEKQIPDDTPHAGLAKLDAALRFVLEAYAHANGGKTPPQKLLEQIRQGIQIKHADLDRNGELRSRRSSST